MSTQHTPGPWQIKNEHEPEYIVGDIDGPDDGTMYYKPVAMVMETTEFDANARLIAAAPELLEALRGMLEVCESPDFDGRPSDAALNVARAAIAKATGQS